jgi:hypothetical protein
MVGGDRQSISNLKRTPGSRGNMGGFCGKQLLVWKFELDAVGFFKTKFTGE